jgi:aconitate hydratase
MKTKGEDISGINPACQFNILLKDKNFYNTLHSEKAAMMDELKQKMNPESILRWGVRELENVDAFLMEDNKMEAFNVLNKLVHERENLFFPETVLGTDDNANSLNPLGVVGWKVSKEEAFSVLIGEPITVTLPNVVGVKLSGSLPTNTTKEDLENMIFHLLEQRGGAKNQFVEFIGEGAEKMNMSAR